MLVGLPAGVVAGAVAGWLAHARLWATPANRPPLVGVATVGYAVLGLSAVSYAVPPTRAYLGGYATLGLAVVVGLVVAVVAYRRGVGAAASS